MPRRMKQGLVIPDELVALIWGMHPHLKKQVRAALRDILENSAAGKPLKAELAGLYSYRIGTYRIIYRVREHIELVAVGPRASIYQLTTRLVKNSS
ncbi:MAG TPA: type II toxin-antitoxin system RelE/ParE family toxin [bacterium]|nr:type II toxin-antitoxin system RelE/ParE family toxin [bacterium]